MQRVLPFGDRILVKRRTVGDKIGAAGIIIAADQTAERPTDLADVIYVPDHTSIDAELIGNAEAYVYALAEKSKAGDAQAFQQLLQFNHYLKLKSVKVGDRVMISKYVGTTFHDNKGGGNLTLVSAEDIIGLVVIDSDGVEDKESDDADLVMTEDGKGNDHE